MKQSLLELTQDVLNATDGSDVNSISDTTESLQVATDIRVVFYDLIGRKDWQFLRKLKSLDSVSDLSYPTHLKIPDNTSRIETLSYNKKKVSGGRNYYTDLLFKYPDEFLSLVNARDNTQSNYTEIVDYDGAKIVIKTDEHPTYYTSFDDKYIVMDAYDSSLEATLQGANTQALLYIIPSWSVDNAFTPDLPSEMFPFFLSECISYAQARKEGKLLQKTEQTAGRHTRHLSQTHGVVQDAVRYPNYGRISGKNGYSRRSSLFGDNN